MSLSSNSTDDFNITDANSSLTIYPKKTITSKLHEIQWKSDKNRIRWAALLYKRVATDASQHIFTICNSWMQAGHVLIYVNSIIHVFYLISKNTLKSIKWNCFFSGVNDGLLYIRYFDLSLAYLAIHICHCLLQKTWNVAKDLFMKGF